MTGLLAIPQNSVKVGPPGIKAIHGMPEQRLVCVLSHFRARTMLATFKKPKCHQGDRVDLNDKLKTQPICSKKIRPDRSMLRLIRNA